MCLCSSYSLLKENKTRKHERENFWVWIILQGEVKKQHQLNQMPASEARQLCAMATMRQRTAQQPLQELREPPSAIIFNWKLEKTRNTADLKEENSNTNSHLCFEQLQTSLFSTKKTEQSQLWLTVECKTSLKENKIYIPCFSHTQKPKPQSIFQGSHFNTPFWKHEQEWRATLPLLNPAGSRNTSFTHKAMSPGSPKCTYVVLKQQFWSS